MFGAVAVASAAMLIAVVSGPHWLSYFNFASGGMSNGYQKLCDSNVDWGQDLPAVQAWLEDHPEAKANLHFAFFGSYDPVNLGIQYRDPVQLQLEKASSEELRASTQKIDEGWYIVSKNYVLGHQMPMPDGQSRLVLPTTPRDGLSYLRDLKPVDEIGGSMFVYKLSGEDIRRASTLLLSKHIAPVAKENDLDLQPIALGTQSF